jgi:hypothetical protein
MKSKNILRVNEEIIISQINHSDKSLNAQNTRSQIENCINTDLENRYLTLLKKAQTKEMIQLSNNKNFENITLSSQKLSQAAEEGILFAIQAGYCDRVEFIYQNFSLREEFIFSEEYREKVEHVFLESLRIGYTDHLQVIQKYFKFSNDFFTSENFIESLKVGWENCCKEGDYYALEYFNKNFNTKDYIDESEKKIMQKKMH